MTDEERQVLAEELTTPYLTEFPHDLFEESNNAIEKIKEEARELGLDLE